MAKKSERETRREYLILMNQGKTIEEIAAERGITCIGAYIYLYGHGLLKDYYKIHPEQVFKRPDYTGLEEAVADKSIKTKTYLAKLFGVSRQSMYLKLHEKKLINTWNKVRNKSKPPYAKSIRHLKVI